MSEHFIESRQNVLWHAIEQHFIAAARIRVGVRQSYPAPQQERSAKNEKYPRVLQNEFLIQDAHTRSVKVLFLRSSGLAGGASSFDLCPPRFRHRNTTY
jgi:hypothetical protein